MYPLTLKMRAIKRDISGREACCLQLSTSRAWKRSMRKDSSGTRLQIEQPLITSHSSVVWKFPLQNGLICSQAQLSQLAATKGQIEPERTIALSDSTSARTPTHWWPCIINSYKLWLIYSQQPQVSCFTGNIKLSTWSVCLLSQNIPLRKGQLWLLS